MQLVAAYTSSHFPYIPTPHGVASIPVPTRRGAGPCKSRFSTTVTIIGAGSGGFGLLTNLGCAGYRIRLHDLDDTKLAAIREHGGVDVEHGPRPFAPVDLATTDLAAAVAGADLLIFVTGGTTHAALARAAAPFLEEGQLVLLIQGNTGGALIVQQS